MRPLPLTWSSPLVYCCASAPLRSEVVVRARQLKDLRRAFVFLLCAVKSQFAEQFSSVDGWVMRCAGTDPVTPTPCPFNDAYYFSYSDHVTGSCDQTISYAKPCVGHTKYLLHFKQCATQEMVVLDPGRGQSVSQLLTYSTYAWRLLQLRLFLHRYRQ